MGNDYRQNAFESIEKVNDLSHEEAALHICKAAYLSTKMLRLIDAAFAYCYSSVSVTVASASAAFAAVSSSAVSSSASARATHTTLQSSSTRIRRTP